VSGFLDDLCFTNILTTEKIIYRAVFGRSMHFGKSKRGIELTLQSIIILFIIAVVVIAVVIFMTKTFGGIFGG
jgi:subtilase family serine protease